jgi:hypothetical protein
MQLQLFHGAVYVPKPRINPHMAMAMAMAMAGKQGKTDFDAKKTVILLF